MTTIMKELEMVRYGGKKLAAKKSGLANNWVQWFIDHSS